MNIVATPQTKRIANIMLRDTLAGAGGDAVVNHLATVRPEQIPALVATILDTAVPRRRKPYTLTLEERLRGYSQYTQGVRTPFAIAAFREYKRAHKRGERRQGSARMVARMIAEEEQYTHKDARRARTAYEHGDKSEWARVGARVYYRRAKRGDYRRQAS